jgi:hypothetical protein
MIKIAFAFAATVAVVQPALAETFTRDGSTYTYKVEQRGKSTLISGIVEDTREPFELLVTGKRVNGSVAGRPVSFSTRDVVSSKPTVVAAR